MYESLFVKIAGLQVYNFMKKRLRHRCFLCEYCELFKNTYFGKHLETTASEDTPTLTLSYEICEIFKNNYCEEHVRKTASICFTSKYYNNEWWRDLDRMNFIQLNAAI